MSLKDDHRVILYGVIQPLLQVGSQLLIAMVIKNATQLIIKLHVFHTVEEHSLDLVFAMIVGTALQVGRMANVIITILSGRALQLSIDLSEVVAKAVSTLGG